MLDFAALPPEVNSARMYSGPGSAPMLAAAGGWTTMAAELRSAATSYGSVVSELVSEGWFGPSSASMVAAAAPYVEWLSAVAGQAEQAGVQAHAAATAYESAFAATVPPAVIVANRAELAMLVATNVFGQNTPAIAATEARYAEMWAQDAAAMNGYAGASAAATQLAPLTSPQSGTQADAVATQAATVAHAAQTPAGTVQSTLSSAGSNAAGSFPFGSVSSELAGLLAGTDNSAVGTFWNGNYFSTLVVNGALAGGPYNPEFILGTIAGFNFLNTSESGGALLSNLGDAAAVGTGAAESAAYGSTALGSTALTGLGSAVSAGLGHAGLVGAVSVPPSWASAAAISPAETAVPVTGLSEIGSSAPAAGGQGGFAAPMGGAGGRRRAIPKYGFRPVVMSRPPAAG